MKFASLGSGSEGNALVISAGEAPEVTTVMVDCGFNLRETERRLARLGLTPADLTALVVTHEHHDHVAGIPLLARRYRLPVWLTRGTWRAMIVGKADSPLFPIHFCEDAASFAIGSLRLEPYTVPHDAREPVQYVVTDGRSRLGILTDAGAPTPYIIHALGACDALFIECNHDVQMLAASRYPARLRSRIGSSYGHLSNGSAVDIVQAMDRSRLKTVVAAHLSKENNTPGLARDALLAGLPDGSIDIRIASQEEGLEWVEMACER